jgi:hypothetical protein
MFEHLLLHPFSSYFVGPLRSQSSQRTLVNSSFNTASMFTHVVSYAVLFHAAPKTGLAGLTAAHRWNMGANSVLLALSRNPSFFFARGWYPPICLTAFFCTFVVFGGRMVSRAKSTCLLYGVVFGHMRMWKCELFKPQSGAWLAGKMYQSAFR